MKFIKIAVAVLALMLAGTTKAQTYASQSVTIGGASGTGALPTLLPTSGTSNVYAVLDVRKAENVALQWKHANSGDSNVTVTLTFDYSVDGVTFGDAPTTAWALPEKNAVGTATTYVTNLSTLGYGYMRLKTMAMAASGTTITNLDFQYSLKLLTKP